MKKGIQNSYSTFPSSVNMRYGNYMSNGGAMNQLTEFNEGGRHEENGLGGIPQGMNPDGQMNLVEEGETKFDAENYIFSDTLKVDKELAKAFNLSPKMIGKTFADASKMAGRKNSRREGDKIEEAANNADLMNLMEAQEAFKQKEIEKRLAEISQLDPTVLPAMMGQGDPAMGGQMQEASMMDQEAMMAQQGGPSPEEMAMMQNEMMGQQEGMMRSGGKIPKSVLLSRAKSHMSDAAAQEYVKNYDNGGNLGGPYPRHSIGLGYKRPVYPMTEEEARRQKIYEGPYKDHVEMLNDIDLAFDNPTALVTGEQLAGDKSSFKDYLKWWDSPPSYLHLRRGPADLPPEAEKLGGYLGDGKSSFGGGGYMSRSYAPGGFMGMGMNALPDPPDTPITNTNPRSSSSIFDPSTTNPNLQGMSDFLAQKMLSTQGAVASDPPVNVPTPSGSGGISFPSFGFRTKEERINDRARKQDKIDDYARDLSLVEEGDMTDETFFDKYSEKDRNYYSRKIKGPGIGTRRPSNPQPKFTKPGWIASRLNPRMEPLQTKFWNPQLRWTEGNQKMRRGGGKLCYGCGGAMYAYGGRMDGISPNQAKYGKWLDLASNTLGTAASVIGNVPVIGTAIGAGLGTLSGVTGSLADNARASDDGKVDWKGIDYGDMALQAGMGAGAGALGTVGSTLTNLGGQGVDALTTSKYETQEAAHQDIINNPDKYSIEEYEAALAKEKDRGNNSALFNIANQAIGIGGQIASGKIGKGATEEVAGDIMDSSIDTIDTIGVDNLPELNIARYGRKLGKGGGLWANIHAKRERIAAGSGERMRKPGSKGAPTAEALRNSQNAMGGHLYYPGGYLFGPAGEMPSTPIPDPVEKQDDTYGSDMPSSFIDMSTGTNPLGLVSPIYNLGMGLFGQESDLSYPVEKFTYKPFDFTESKNALRRQAAKALDSLRKTGNTNPSNILALKNLNAQTEAAYLERAENINAQREQAAADNNTKLVNKYNKELRELRLKNEAIKDEFIKAGLQDLTGFAEQERQNEYMFNFLKTMAPNVVTGSYNSIFDIFNRKDKKDKKDK